MMFFAVVVAIWILIHLYLGWRLIGPLAYPPRIKRLLWAALTAMCLLFPLLIASRLSLPKPFYYGPLYSLTFTMASYILILAPFLLFKDALMGLSGLIERIGGGSPDFDPERRRALSVLLNGGIVIASGGFTVLGRAQARQAPVQRKVKIIAPGLSPALEGLTIAQLSDIHVSESLRRADVERIVEITNSLSPDLIAITGDLVDGFVEEMGDDVAPLKNLSAPLGVFFVTGNHEYYWDLPGWLAHAAGMGFTILNNEHRVVKRGGAKLLVAGVTDYSAWQYSPSHASDPEKAFAGARERDFTLGLAHQPRSVDAMARAGADLTLCGHTHGGQFFPYTMVVPLIHPYPPGLSRAGEGWVHVSRGTGYWGPPNRLSAPPEITLLTLTKA
ncbi:MAG: metallophosphoesterase [Nitrospinae bacterium]|nr:metallophosphoesterase [Nitrospinota bacterium]